MQKKLFFFHTFALVTAMAILLAVNSGVLHVVMGYYQRRAIPAADERSQQARVVLDSWDEKDEDWDELSKRLRAADYDLVVCRDGEIVSSGLDQGQQEFFTRMIQSASWPEEGTLTVQDSGVVLVGRQAGNYLLVALPHPGHPDGPGGFGGHRPQAEVMLISVFVSGLAAMGVIWLFSVVFARYQLRQIMRPVNALTAGAKRVEQGDLSTPIDYQGRDEFAAVCAAFDHMQRHLLEEREKNAAYERARTDLVAGISHDLRTPLTSMKGKVYKAGRELKMPNREFELLKFLAEHPNIVFSKDRLFETIWGFDYVGDSATVTVHVGRIRDKIEDDPSKPRIIETVWGAGYRLNAKG